MVHSGLILRLGFAEKAVRIRCIATGINVASDAPVSAISVCREAVRPAGLPHFPRGLCALLWEMQTRVA
jgi:hypothetical protein